MKLVVIAVLGVASSAAAEPYKQEMGGFVKPARMQFLAMSNVAPFANAKLACEDLRKRYGNGAYGPSLNPVEHDNNSNLAFDCRFPALKKGEQEWLSQGQVTGEWVCPDLATIEIAPDTKYLKLRCQCPSNMWAQVDRCVTGKAIQDPCAQFPEPQGTGYLPNWPDAKRCPMSEHACGIKRMLGGDETPTGTLSEEDQLDKVALTKSAIAVSWGTTKDGKQIKLVTTNDKRIWEKLKTLIGSSTASLGSDTVLMPDPPLPKEHAEDAAYRYWSKEWGRAKRTTVQVGTCPKGCPQCSTEFVKKKYAGFRFERLNPSIGE